MCVCVCVISSSKLLKKNFFFSIALRIHKDIENLLSNNDDDDDEQSNNNDNDNYSNHCNQKIEMIRWLNESSIMKTTKQPLSSSSSSRLSIWNKDPMVIAHMMKYKNNNNNSEINEPVQQQQQIPVINSMIINDIHDDDHQSNDEQKESNDFNQFNLIMDRMILSRLENDQRVDFYSNNYNQNQNFDQNHIDYLFNEYFHFCLIELQLFEKEIDYSILKQSNKMKSIGNGHQQQVQSLNHQSSKWPISLDGNHQQQINPNQLHLFIWNLFNLHEKLSSFYSCQNNNDSSPSLLPSSSSLSSIINNEIDNLSTIIIRTITVWYEIVEKIKDNFVKQNSTTNCFDDDPIMNAEQINQLKRQQIVQLKLLWQLTRQIRLLHWTYDF